MNKEVRQHYHRVVANEEVLYELIVDKENHMNECSCNNRKSYNFINSQKLNNIYCLNCGGYIEPGEI